MPLVVPPGAPLSPKTPNIEEGVNPSSAVGRRRYLAVLEAQGGDWSGRRDLIDLLA